MHSPDLHEHLHTLEKSLLDPTLRQSPHKVAALLTPDFQEITSRGQLATREQILVLIADDPADRSLEDFRIRLLAPTIALATYRYTRCNPDGQTQRSLRSSIWQRDEAGQWKMAFNQGTPIPA